MWRPVALSWAYPLRAYRGLRVTFFTTLPIHTPAAAAPAAAEAAQITAVSGPRQLSEVVLVCKSVIVSYIVCFTCYQGGYAYIRLNNPTCEAVQKAINAVEGGFHSIVFSSGMAAISSTLLTFLHPGDHIVCICCPSVCLSHTHVCTVYELSSHYGCQGLFSNICSGLDITLK